MVSHCLTSLRRAGPSHMTLCQSCDWAPGLLHACALSCRNGSEPFMTNNNMRFMRLNGLFIKSPICTHKHIKTCTHNYANSICLCACARLRCACCASHGVRAASRGGRGTSHENYNNSIITFAASKSRPLKTTIIITLIITIA